MKVIILGASGFIGAYLTMHLAEMGHEVIPAGRSQRAGTFYRSIGLDLIPVDVGRASTFDLLPSDGIDAVVNLAALIPAAHRSRTAGPFATVNTVGACNSLTFCVVNDIPVHLLTTSHFAVEGFWGRWDVDGTRITEAMGVCYPDTGDHAAYIVSKVAAEAYARHFGAEWGLRSIVYRLSGVRGFGRYESGFEFFVRQAQAGRDIEVFGDQGKVWDNIYVKDVVKAIDLALEGDRVSGLYLLSSGIPLTLMQEVEAVADWFSPPDRRVRTIPRPDLPGGIRHSYVYDIDRLRSDAGFEPDFPLNEARTMADYASEVESMIYQWLREERNG
jgi:UDP-glucose 4-epimerase